MTLAAVMVTHNRLAALQASLPCLLAEAVDRIVVVDNASTDGTADWLAGQTDPRLKILRLPDNRGGAGGFEAGMAMLRAGPEDPKGPDTAGRDLHGPDPDWIVLMDDDAHPAPGALAAFRAYIATAEPDIGVVAAATFLPGGTPSEMNRPSRNPFWHAGLFLRTLLRGNREGFHLADAAYGPDAPVRDIDLGSFVGYFVSRAAIDKAGLPEAGLFIYGDDVLYSLRLRRAGIRIVFHPGVRFIHDCGTMGAGFVYRPLWKIYYHCRNGVAIALAAAGPVIFPLALGWYLVVWARRGRYCTGAERALYRRMMWRGVRDGLLWRRGRNDAVHRMVP